MKHARLPLLLAVVAMTAADDPSDYTAEAAMPHFRLLEPASWLVEDQRGDPQKAGPCGGSNTNWGQESFAVTEVRGGQLLHLALQETIYHPGHYRVALAINSPTELPLDPVTVTREGERGPISVSAEIQDPAVPPVLADGLFVHNERPASPQTYETDIRIPNVDCDHCVMQVVQFMAEHAFNNPGGYSYHHCAILRVTADPSMPLDTRWPAQRAE